MASSQDQFHRNVRWFLDQIVSGQSFVKKLRHVWLTEGRLCSVERETGGRKDRTCADRYLANQISLMPGAVVVAFGAKAHSYLAALGVPYCSARALAPPGANHKPAKPSWEAAIAQIHRADQRM